MSTHVNGNYDAFQMFGNWISREIEFFGREGGSRVNRPVSTLCSTAPLHFLHLCINLIIPLFTLFTLFWIMAEKESSWGCNTAAARHHERTCIDMDIIVVQAAFPHTFDQQVTRKALILNIGVCIMEEK